MSRQFFSKVAGEQFCLPNFAKVRGEQFCCGDEGDEGDGDDDGHSAKKKNFIKFLKNIYKYIFFFYKK